ncbi:hypothetical protein ACI65C_004344 [Semiaphis heraclei]
MSFVGKSIQDEGTENKEYGKIDDTDQKHDNKIASDKTPKQEQGTDSKKYGKIDDTDQKPEDKDSSVKKFKQEDGTENKKSDKVDNTDQKPEDKDSSVKKFKQEGRTDNKETDKDRVTFVILSKQEDGTENKESDRIDDTDQKPEDKDSSVKKFKQEDGTENKKSDKVDDTDQNPEDKDSSVKKFKQEDGTENKKSDKVDDTDQKPEDKDSSVKKFKQEDGTENKKSDKVDDSDQKPEDKDSSVKKFKQEGRTDNKESDKVDDTDQKPEDKDSSVKKFKQEDGTENKKSDKVDNTDQKPEDKDSSVKKFKQEGRTDNKESDKDRVTFVILSKQEDGTENKESDRIDDTDQKPEDKDSSVKKFKQEDGTENKKSDKVDDTDQKPEDKDSSVKKFKQEDGTENKKSDKVDDIDQKPKDRVTFVISSKQENGTENKESDRIDDTDKKPEDKVTSVIPSKQEDGTENKELDKISDTEQKSEKKVTFNKTSNQRDGTNHKKSVKIDGVMKPEDKICIDNKFRIESGPSFPIKTNLLESGESSAKLSLKYDNEESEERNKKILLEDRTCVKNEADSEDGLPLTTVDEVHTDEMSLHSIRTSEIASNSRKRYQKQNEGLEDNDILSKKIKIEDTSDDQFREMWDCLQYDFSNFNLWENILQMADVQNIELNARMAYSKFLELYPLCYGYWKKYANFEKRNNNIHEFEKVLENGLSVIPSSVDLWVYYMTYLRTERYDEEDHIRNEFERSLKMCGLDFLSDQLWHDYISWEMEINQIFNAANIYYRLIRVPTSNYLKNFIKFQEFIFKQLPEEYLGLTAYFERRHMIVQSFRSNHNSASFSHDCTPPGEDFQQVTEITETMIISLLRVEIIDEWYNVHKQTATEFESRKVFEENIRRPHYHVNELESDQIINWENYIKFERRAGDQERIIFLYERCLIPCVLVERFWLNYIDYLSFVNFDATILLSDVFKRSLFYHPKSFQLNIKYSDFCETQGWTEIAVETIVQLETIYPDSKEIVIKLLNFARRTQDGRLKILFNHYLNSSRLKSLTSYIAIKYARFVWKHDRQLNLAFEILCDAIRIRDISVNDSLEIYLTLVNVKMELNPKDHLSVLKTIDDIMLQCHFYKEKLVFSKKKLEYIEDYIVDYDMLRLATIEHNNLKKASITEKRQSSSIHNCVDNAYIFSPPGNTSNISVTAKQSICRDGIE